MGRGCPRSSCWPGRRKAWQPGSLLSPEMPNYRAVIAGEGRTARPFIRGSMAGKGAFGGAKVNNISLSLSSKGSALSLQVVDNPNCHCFSGLWLFWGGTTRRASNSLYNRISNTHASKFTDGTWYFKAAFQRHLFKIAPKMQFGFWGESFQMLKECRVINLFFDSICHVNINNQFGGKWRDLLI